MRIHVLLVLVGLFFIASFCASRQDDSLDKALFNFFTLCQGGSETACKNQCKEEFGENVTTENLTQVTRCFNTCQSNCDIRNIFLLWEATR